MGSYLRSAYTLQVKTRYERKINFIHFFKSFYNNFERSQVQKEKKTRAYEATFRAEASIVEASTAVRS